MQHTATLSKAYEVLDSSFPMVNAAYDSSPAEKLELSNGNGSSQDQQQPRASKTEIIISDSPCLPLLSPFVDIKHGHSDMVSEAKMTHFHHDFLLPASASSPTHPPQSSGPANNLSPINTDILQSPFGIHTPCRPRLLEDASPTEPSKESSPMKYVLEVGQSETDSSRIPLSDDIGCQSSGDETIINLLSTPTFVSRAPDNSLSLSFDELSVEDARKLEQVICAKSADVNSDYVHNQPKTNGNMPNMSISGRRLPRIVPEVDSEVVSVNVVPDCSPTREDEQVAMITAAKQATTPSDNSQESTKSSGSQSNSRKRPREAEVLFQPPAPKRMTLASQKKQHQKLSSPFRSPLLSKANPGNVGTPDRARTGLSRLSPLSTPLRKGNEGLSSSPLKEIDVPRSATLPHIRPVKAGTATATRPASSVKATSQFKSPVMSSPTLVTPLRLNSSRKIQDLEQKLQVLKRANKIKKDGDEAKLEELVKKWRGVGREAAWELWQIVRDNNESSDAPYPGTSSKSSGGSFTKSYGWSDSSRGDDRRGSNGFGGQSSWGWDELPGEKEVKDKCEDDGDDNDYEPESPSKLEDKLYQSLRNKPAVPRTSMLPPTPRGAYYTQQDTEVDDEHYSRSGMGSHKDDAREEEDPESLEPLNKSLGTMLSQLGIAHETLGWVEDEGDFADA
ncbi:hypothetical protein EW145_g5025 [Phellinidium pouzarii]|uniref:Swi5-dependent recombination DNA repair protein 1 n=1 Tax=Phellinidium pouzarii TaxID=167371 RepID=A0A4V3XCA5_9AGAM|nr:hypothetical protein EW145_g5025 [Phellinidium pouzarii]